MRKIIINADDFGIHESVNLGILYGHTCGAISSATIMATGKAFEHAVALSAENPDLGVGIHLTLVGECPAASLDKVSSLIDEHGRLPRLYPQFLRKLIQGSIRLDEVRIELEAQITKVMQAGLKPTHLDSHQHMHVVPGVIDLVIDLARQYQIHAIRIPAEPLLFLGGFPATTGRFIGRGGLSILAQKARYKVIQKGLKTTNHFYGMLAGGSMTEPYLLEVVQQLPLGVTEIMMHPGQDDHAMKSQYGWNYNWQAELAAVTGTKLQQILAERKIAVISFRGLNE